MNTYQQLGTNEIIEAMARAAFRAAYRLGRLAHAEWEATRAFGPVTIRLIGELANQQPKIAGAGFACGYNRAARLPTTLERARHCPDFASGIIRSGLEAARYRRAARRWQ